MTSTRVPTGRESKAQGGAKRSPGSWGVERTQDEPMVGKFTDLPESFDFKQVVSLALGCRLTERRIVCLRLLRQTLNRFGLFIEQRESQPHSHSLSGRVPGFRVAPPWALLSHPSGVELPIRTRKLGVHTAYKTKLNHIKCFLLPYSPSLSKLQRINASESL